MHHALQGREVMILGNYQFGTTPRVEDSEVTEDMALEFLALQLVNWTGCCLTQCWPCGLTHCQCRYWLPGTQQRVRLAQTWRTRSSLGGLWFGAKDLAKEADLKASSGWMSWWTRHFEDYNGPVVERPMQGRDIAGIFPIIWRINCYFLAIVHWISSASCHMIVAHLGIAMGELQWIFLTWRGDFFDLWSCSMD